MQTHFCLKATLGFNTEFPVEAVPVVEGLVNEANTVLFRRGVPAGAAEDEVGRITAWKVDGNELTLEIESGPYTRAHDALFRFRKQIAPRLGKFRLGLRGIEVKAFHISMKGEFPAGMRLPALPFINSFTLEGNALELDLRMEAAELEDRVPDRLVHLVEEKCQAVEYGGKAEHWELCFESKKRAGKYSGDPTEEMVRRGWIKHGVSRGQWIHGPQSTQLFRAFEQIVFEEIIGPLGFSEMIFPKLVPWEVWKHSGHAKGVYPEIYYVCTPKTRDPAYWEEVADWFKVTGEVPVDLIRSKIDGPIGGLTYAQCPSFWPFVQGETLATDSLPIKIFDRSGTSHRYESGGIHGIERVDEFHRIEILWLGTVEQTCAIADTLHQAYMRVFEDILELEWRAAKVTPWFMAQEGMIGTGSDSCGCGARVGTTDYEALLPYNKNWLEFQNVSINGDKYPKGFSVKIQSGKDLWSGCSGIGLERWTAAFLAQKGFELSEWPERVASIVGTPKELFKFL